MSTSRKVHPPEIYLRRRIAALVVILLVVIALLVAWSAFHSGSTSADNSAPASVSDTLAAPATDSSTEAAPTTSATAASEGAGVTSDAASENAQPSAAASSALSSSVVTSAAGAQGACALGDLSLTVRTDKAFYSAGELPVFVMEVKNPTAADCKINLDQEQLRFEVYNMRSNARMWADTDCYPSVQTGEQTFKAGETRAFQATWSRTESAPGKCAVRPEAPVDSYYVHALIGSNYSESTEFNLR